jgi:hypothetical protein
MKPTEFKFERKETEGNRAAVHLAMPNVLDLPGGDPADFEHWHRVARWTIEEATALSFGIEPRWVAWAKVKEWVYPCGEDYKKRLTLGLRAYQAGDLQEPTEAIAYIAWAKAVAIPFPTELEQMTREAAAAKPVSAPKQGEAINPRRLESLYKLILGMAVAKYQYDHTRESRNPGHALIQRSVESVGLKMDEQPVHDILREAARALGDQIQPRR